MRNDLAPINRLPAEILSMVFEHLLDSPPLAGARFLGANPPVYQWAGVHAVCRRWREIAVSTPKLWGRIYAYRGPGTSLGDDIVSTSFLRAGSTPLAVYVVGETQVRARAAGLLHRSLKQILLENSSRIRDLRMADVESLIIHHVIREASQLETLFLAARNTGTMGLEDSDYSLHAELAASMTPPGDWKMPCLRTLIISGLSGWHSRTTSLHTLRHFVLDNQDMDAAALDGLHDLLVLNPQLEDLALNMLRSSDPEHAQAIIETMPMIDMPALKRVKAGDCSYGYDFGAGIIGRLTLPMEHARVYSRLLQSNMLHHFASTEPCPFPARKLFVGTPPKNTRRIASSLPVMRIIGTDGRMSIQVRTDSLTLLENLALPSHATMGELWWWIRADTSNHVGLDISIAEAESFRTTKKVVLLFDIAWWLARIAAEDLFPALTELQIHSQPFIAQYPIAQRLQILHQRGKAVDTLRFVRERILSDGVTSEAFEDWREDPTTFSPFVRNVIFEDYNDKHPQRMELPDICAPSSIHTFWPAWVMDPDADGY